MKYYIYSKNIIKIVGGMKYFTMFVVEFETNETADESRRTGNAHPLGNERGCYQGGGGEV